MSCAALESARRRVPAPLLLVWATALLLAGPGPASADGSQTGTLVGRVLDAAGKPLPQVPIEIVGDQVRRSATSDAAGSFRFPGLPIGGYRVTADLLGLEATADDVQVYVDRNTELELRLTREEARPAPVPSEEAIQVVALAPLLNPFETRVSSSVSREFLEGLPVERFYQSAAALLPGVSGGEDGNPNVSGALRSGNLYLVDGVDTTDPVTGLFGLNLNYEAIDEVEVITAAAPVEYGRVSGAPINVVTRAGGGRLHGAARWLFADAGWMSDYTDPAPSVAEEIRAANAGSTSVADSLAANLSGPIAPNRLWFFASLEEAETGLQRPTLEGTPWDEEATVETAFAKLTARLSEHHSLTAQYASDSADFASFTSFDRRPNENRTLTSPGRLGSSFFDRIPGDVFALQAVEQNGEFARLQWEGAWGQSLFATAAVASQERRLERSPLNSRGLTGGAPHLAFVDALGAERAGPESQVFGVFNGLTDTGFEERDRDQGNARLQKFLRLGRSDHELRIGFDYQSTESVHAFNFSGSRGTDRGTGRPVEGQLFDDLDLRPECVELGRCVDFDPATGEFQANLLFNYWRREPARTRQRTAALYLSDTIQLDRFLISLGMRMENVRGEAGDGRRLVDDESIAPRLGIKYDPTGRGRTLYSATYSHFYEPFSQEFLENFVIPSAQSGFSLYGWLGPFDPDCSGADPTDLDSECWLFLGFAPLQQVQAAPPSRALSRSYVEEITVGVERQLAASTALRVTFVDREWEDLWDDRLTVVDGQVEFELANLPQARRSYRGVLVLLHHRPTRGLQLLASFSWSKIEGNLFRDDGLAFFADFDDVVDTNVVNQFGRASYDPGREIKVFANYQRRLGPALLSLGSVAQYRDGFRYQREQPEAGGIRFLTPRGSLQLEERVQWDVSASLGFRLGETFEVEVEAEAFNLTDESARLGVDSNVDSGQFGEPRSIADLQRPRSFRLLVGLRF